jgi:tetratricopeptide (TPR) repeat protein
MLLPGGTLLLAIAVGFAIGGGLRTPRLGLEPRVPPAATAPATEREVRPVTTPSEVAVAPSPASLDEPETARVDAALLARAQLLQGRDRLADGDLAAGLEAFEAAVQLDSNAETNGALGALYFLMAARTEAYTHLQRAAELDPQNPDRWLALANAEHLRTNPGAAWEAVRRARELDPGLSVERDSSGFVYRADRGPESVFYGSTYLPSRRNTP